MHSALRYLFTIWLLACVSFAHAGYFVTHNDEKNLSKIKDLRIKSARRYKHIGWTYIDVPPQAERKLKSAAGNRKIKLIPDSVVTLSQTPTDPGTENQNYITPGYANADIHLTSAWDVLTTATCVVAIIDSGMQLDHEDLAANVWTNQAELNGTAGVDDDNNGYIDDVNGWNTRNNNNNPADTLGHGTRVAGIIGARAQNGVGIAGVCWDVKMMPLRAFEGTTTTTSAIIDAFDYIFSTEGVRVINASFSEDTYNQAFYDAILEARTRGILVVAAAGNSARNIDIIPAYPASYNLPNLISVGAIDVDGTLWFSSNFGYSVSIVAPGNLIYSTNIGNTYTTSAGTSMAAPIISGAAALLMTQWPLMQVDDVKRQITMTGRMTNPLLTEQIGGGVVNIHAMLTHYVSAARDWQLYR